MFFGESGVGETFTLSHAAFDNHGVAIAHVYGDTIDVYTGPRFQPSFMMILRRRSPEVAIWDALPGASLTDRLSTDALERLVEAFTDVDDAGDWWREQHFGLVGDVLVGDTLVATVQEQIRRGRIQLYRFAAGERQRLFDPDDPLFAAPVQPAVDDELGGGERSERQLRRRLASECGRILAVRWRSKDAADAVFYEQNALMQSLTLAGGFASGVGDVAMATYEGALSGLTMAFEIVGDAVQSMDADDWRLVLAAAAGGPVAFVATVTPSQWESVREAMAGLGADIEGGWERVRELAETGAAIVETLLGDPGTRRILKDFLWGYFDSYRDTAFVYAAGQLVGGIAIEVLVALGLAAVGSVASLGRRVGRFSRTLIELMEELAGLLRRARASAAADELPEPPSRRREDIIPWRRDRNHDDRDRDADQPGAPGYTVPNSLGEALERLQRQRERIRQQGLAAARPRYDDDQLARMAERARTDGIDDRFIVRLTERKYTGDGDTIGPTDANGNAKYWTAPLRTAEPGDTDPRALAQLLGKDYDPEADYSVAVVDLQQSNLREEASTFVPTNRNMAAFAKQEISYIDPHRVDEVMTDRYARRYEEARSAMDAAGRNVNSAESTNMFSQSYFDNAAERQRFKTRAAIERELGANAQFRGDGRTAYGGVGQETGSLETYTFDRKPRTYNELTGVERLDAEPVTGD
ncbi:hypothetical protein QWY84_18445 [Aquisalimonas lutea]|uniref:hypothetical protein n=1 Tax=Aquisalimonas lutea TaxID=1327750 RepID=UPI0025B3D0BB|nr:hypothetical protein [Aquisalimonas lutea]MDN3519592.1 hypothetical protein [Aquisalimonas lutea]